MKTIYTKQFSEFGARPEGRVITVSFEPIPEGDPNPLYRVFLDVGVGVSFGCLLTKDEAEEGQNALVRDKWQMGTEE